LILRSTRRISFPDGHSALAFAYQPALSPDGTRIAYFDGMYDHSHNLWVANADGTGRRVVLDDEVSAPGHMRALTWSPDGEWLAFATDGGTYVVRPDGTAYDCEETYFRDVLGLASVTPETQRALGAGGRDHADQDRDERGDGVLEAVAHRASFPGGDESHQEQRDLRWSDKTPPEAAAAVAVQR